MKPYANHGHIAQAIVQAIRGQRDVEIELDRACRHLDAQCGAENDSIERQEALARAQRRSIPIHL